MWVPLMLKMLVYQDVAVENLFKLAGLNSFILLLDGGALAKILLLLVRL